jgi:hypothetical protein
MTNIIQHLGSAERRIWTRVLSTSTVVNLVVRQPRGRGERVSRTTATKPTSPPAAPLATVVAWRGPHSLHRNSRAQSGTGIPAPCCATWVARSGSLW